MNIWISMVFVSLLLLWCNARRFQNFVADDAFISLRYADRLIQGKGLNWNDAGPAVEGYSNLLWVLMCAVLRFTGVAPVLALRILGFTCFSTCLALLAWHFSPRATTLNKKICLMFGLAVFALSGPIGVWSMGGLEQPLYALLILIVFVLLLRIADRDLELNDIDKFIGIILGLIIWTRPEGFIWTLLIFGGFILLKLAGIHVRKKSFFIILLFPATFFLGQMLFRLGYYHAWVPNTALAKISPSRRHFQDGFNYIYAALSVYQPLTTISALAVFCLFISKLCRVKAIIIIVSIFTWCASVVLAGGDIFPAYRHFIPALILLILWFIEGAFFLTSHVSSRNPKFKSILLLLFLVISLFFFHDRQSNDRQVLYALEENWEWRAKELGLTLKAAFAESKPLIAVTAAGSLPYGSELPTLDMLGLNDHYLTRHLPPDFGQGYLGHELGDAGYVLSRQPDMIIFTEGLSAEPIFRVGEQLKQRVDFFAQYQIVSLSLDGAYPYSASFWLRRDSGKVGIDRSNDGFLQIPSYLFFKDHPGDRPGVLRKDGSIEVTIHPQEELKVWLNDHALKDLDCAILSGSIEPWNNGSLIKVRSNEAFDVTFTSVGARH